MNGNGSGKDQRIDECLCAGSVPEFVESQFSGPRADKKDLADALEAYVSTFI